MFLYKNHVGIVYKNHVFSEHDGMLVLIYDTDVFFEYVTIMCHDMDILSTLTPKMRWFGDALTGSTQA